MATTSGNARREQLRAAGGHAWKNGFRQEASLPSLPSPSIRTPRSIQFSSAPCSLSSGSYNTKEGGAVTYSARPGACHRCYCYFSQRDPHTQKWRVVLGWLAQPEAPPRSRTQAKSNPYFESSRALIKIARSFGAPTLTPHLSPDTIGRR